VSFSFGLILAKFVYLQRVGERQVDSEMSYIYISSRQMTTSKNIPAITLLNYCQNLLERQNELHSFFESRPLHSYFHSAVAYASAHARVWIVLPPGDRHNDMYHCACCSPSYIFNLFSDVDFFHVVLHVQSLILSSFKTFSNFRVLFFYFFIGGVGLSP
jgi:hypothetical protein